MGFREKVALVLVTIVINQLTITHCMPSTSRKSSLKRYLDSFKQTKTCPKSPSLTRGIKTPKSVFTKNKNVVLNKNAPKKSSYKMYNFPDIEYPLDTSAKDPFYMGTNLNTFRMPDKRAPCAQSQAVSDLKKEMRMKRKLNRYTNIENVRAESEKPFTTAFTSGSEPIWMQSPGMFPEVQYPVSAMETWIPHYWNSPIFTQNEPPFDYPEIPASKALGSFTCRPYKKQVKSKTQQYFDQMEILKAKMKGSKPQPDLNNSANNASSTNTEAINSDTNSQNTSSPETIANEPNQETSPNENSQSEANLPDHVSETVPAISEEEPLLPQTPLPNPTKDVCPVYDYNNTNIEDVIQPNEVTPNTESTSDPINSTNMPTVTSDTPSPAEDNSIPDATGPMNVQLPLPTTSTGDNVPANIPMDVIKQLMPTDKNSYMPVIVLPVDDSSNTIQLPNVETNSDTPVIVFIPSRKPQTCTGTVTDNTPPAPSGIETVPSSTDNDSNSLDTNVPTTPDLTAVEPLIPINSPPTDISEIDPLLPDVQDLPSTTEPNGGTDETPASDGTAQNNPVDEVPQELTPITSPNVEPPVPVDISDIPSIVPTDNLPSDNPLPVNLNDGLPLTPDTSTITEELPSGPDTPKELTPIDGVNTNPLPIGNMDPTGVTNDIVPTLNNGDESSPVSDNVLPENPIPLNDFTEGVIPEENIDIRDVTGSDKIKDSGLVPDTSDVMNNLPTDVTEDDFLTPVSMIPISGSPTDITNVDPTLPLAETILANQATGVVGDKVTPDVATDNLSLDNLPTQGAIESIPIFGDMLDTQDLDNTLKILPKRTNEDTFCPPPEATPLNNTNEEEISSEEDFLMLDTPISNIVQVKPSFPTGSIAHDVSTSNEKTHDLQSSDVNHPDDEMVYLTEHVYTLPEAMELRNDSVTDICVDNPSIPTAKEHLETLTTEDTRYAEPAALLVLDKQNRNNTDENIQSKAHEEVTEELQSDIIHSDQVIPAHKYTPISISTEDEKLYVGNTELETSTGDVDKDVLHRVSLERAQSDTSIFTYDLDKIEQVEPLLLEDERDISKSNLDNGPHTAVLELSITDTAVKDTEHRDMLNNTPSTIDTDKPDASTSELRTKESVESERPLDDLVQDNIPQEKTIEGKDFVPLHNDKVTSLIDKAIKKSTEGKTNTKEELFLPKDLSNAELRDLIKYLYAVV
ncbi:uncharacterized protein LOC142982201 [Anticarsia gemmatalis]|uniref:uncharacterized protein LOC142982201 n=1 Tax=Anticarsia gemmatalis TaxID=129554 RepID=UPI003F760F0B